MDRRWLVESNGVSSKFLFDPLQLRPDLAAGENASGKRAEGDGFNKTHRSLIAEAKDFAAYPERSGPG
jgi:hypothetical protein